MSLLRDLMTLTVLSAFLLLTGCGQKGRLYLEGHEPPSQKAVAKKRRAEQAKQAQSALQNPQATPHEEAADSNKEDLPELAPSAPN